MSGEKGSTIIFPIPLELIRPLLRLGQHDSGGSGSQ
jgi:hypothetical protein